VPAEGSVALRMDLAADPAAQIAEHFRLYNEEFGRITRRAAAHFLPKHGMPRSSTPSSASSCTRSAWRAASRCSVRDCSSARADLGTWIEIKRTFELLVARRPDGDFYNTFFNSVTRDLFGTVGVNRQVEFCETSVGRASGAVPIRVYRVGASLPTAVREIITDLPFGAAMANIDAAVHRISAEIGRFFQSGRHSGAPESIELIEPVFYRGMQAFRGRPPDRRRQHHTPGGGIYQ
jgi:isocitrate dehydrogenase kinase/phosphatase